MKNIHLLSADNPSRLVKIYDDVNRETFTLKLDVEVNDSFKEYVNIYVTSDEEISEGDFGYTNQIEGNIVKIDKQTLAHKEQLELKKVTLTTDQDLIEDGVQAIDDEFLQWFVKNTNCEQISVEEVYFHGSGYYKASELSEQEREKYSFMKKYKIIIPKEEPKTIFESLQEYLKNTPKEKILEDWNEFQHLDNEGITVKEFLENQKQIDEKEK